MKKQKNDGKSLEVLMLELIKLREDQFKLKMRQSIGQLGQTHLLKANKTAIARIKTLLAQKGSGK